ncbi:metallophosphoesterase family protein [Halapricum salinum]|uniref:metallophosphoesterase family protein n=1 Tax=Halapricum salinum TaxID=1457250 RepID=UPI0010A2D0BF|nr:hypothetical protein [Halapricum salinum]
MTDFPYKIIGKIQDATGVGVLGHNTATSGETIGVEGKVESTNGYGLYTDNDAHIGGKLITGQLDVEPLKIGYWTDSHYGTGEQKQFVSTSALNSKISDFAADMNSWGADFVIFGGDNAFDDQSSLSGSQENHQEFYDRMRTSLDSTIGIRTVAGNHEHNESVTWGDMWWADPYPQMETLSDTFYSIDRHQAKIIVLNTSYDGTDDIQGGTPAGQYEWFKSELKTTEKPILVFTHNPIPPANHSGYDSIGINNEQKYSHLMDSYDNIVLCTFGHAHHSNTYGREPTWVKSMLQQWGSTRYLYQHYPHSVGGINSTELDETITPYAKISVYKNGNVSIEQSYRGAGTGYATNWRFNGFSQANTESHYNSMEWEYTDGIQSLDGYAVETTGSDSSVTIETGGQQPHYYLKADAESGSNSALRYQRRPTPLVANEGLDWTDWITNVVIQITDTSGIAGWVTRGGIMGASRSAYAGLYFNDGTLWGQVSDGSGDRQRTATLPWPNEPTHYQMRYDHEVGRFDVSVNHNTVNGLWRVDEHIPSVDHSENGGDPDDPWKLLNATVRNKGSSQKGLRIFDWSIRMSPYMNFTL